VHCRSSEQPALDQRVIVFENQRAEDELLLRDRNIELLRHELLERMDLVAKDHAERLAFLCANLLDGDANSGRL